MGVKIRDPILSDHHERHSRFLRSGTGKDQFSSENHTLFPKTWALCWKDIRTKNPALSVGRVCISWPFAKGPKGTGFTEPIKCTFFSRNVMTAGFQILWLLCLVQEVSINYFSSCLDFTKKAIISIGCSLINWGMFSCCVFPGVWCNFLCHQYIH